VAVVAATASADSSYGARLGLHTMAAAETETAAALQEEVNALQMRVQELERDRLLVLGSQC